MQLFDLRIAPIASNRRPDRFQRRRARENSSARDVPRSRCMIPVRWRNASVLRSDRVKWKMKKIKKWSADEDRVSAFTPDFARFLSSDERTAAHEVSAAQRTTCAGQSDSRPRWAKESALSAQARNRAAQPWALKRRCTSPQPCCPSLTAETTRPSATD